MALGFRSISKYSFLLFHIPKPEKQWGFYFLHPEAEPSFFSLDSEQIKQDETSSLSRHHAWRLLSNKTYPTHNTEATERSILPFQIFPLKKTIKVDAVKVVGKRCYTQVVVNESKEGNRASQKKWGSTIQEHTKDREHTVLITFQKLDNFQRTVPRTPDIVMSPRTRYPIWGATEWNKTGTSFCRGWQKRRSRPEALCS